MNRIALLLGLLTAVWSVSLTAQDAVELERDHRVESAFVTPHTAWAKPYALGPTRVLVFLWGQGMEPREVVELRQRFDFDAQMVFWARITDSDNEHWHGGDLGVQRIDRLLAQKWDAYVFINVPVERLSAEQQVHLLQGVMDGAGLVIVAGDDTRILKGKNKVAPLPSALADTGATAFSVGKGRGLRLPARPQIDYRPGWEVDYDLWAQRFGRSILWAAGHEPQLALRLEAVAAVFPRQSLPAPAATLRWQSPAALPEVTVSATLRRSDGWSLDLPAVTVTGAAGCAAILLPVVRADDYRLDAIARGPRGVEACASLALRVSYPRSIAAITLDPDWSEIGGRLAGEVRLQGVAADEQLVVSLLDRRGRELRRRQSTPGADGVVRFEFPVDSWLPMLVTVRAMLCQEGHELAAGWRFAHVVKRHRDRFNFVMWDYPGGTLGPYGEEALARAGVTVHLSGTTQPPAYLAANEIAYIPYTTRILAKANTNGVMTPYCWNDSSNIQQHVDAIVAKYAPTRGHGVFAYSLGDEGDVRGSCLSPHCLAAYQAYLRQEYGAIAALNASWGSRYADFGDIALTEGDPREQAALKAGNFPRWFDRQAFESYNFCKLCERFGAAFRRLDPESRCGFEGAGTFQAGDDLDGFVRANSFWAPYPGPADEVVRSIAPRDFPRSNWMGYTKDADTLLEKYWRMITRGTDAVWWWRWDSIGRFHGWLSPTLDPFPVNQEILDDTRIVRDGLGRLLVRSEMDDNGMGMLYSQPSAYAARIQQSPSYGSYENEHVAWHNAIRELGLNFRYVTDRMLRLGEADLARFKLLVLPFEQALGAEEARRLRDWVAAGGVLVAGLRPAIYDGHCKPLAAGALDDVFGVRQTAFAEAATRDAALTGEVASVRLAVAAPRLRVNDGLAAEGARPQGGAGATPLFLLHSFGKGHAVLLNFGVSSYPGLAAETTPESAAEALRSLLVLACVQPPLTLTDGAGNRLRNVEITHWRNGDVDLFSLFRHGGAATNAHVVLPGQRYLYDLKARREHGRMQTLDLPIIPARAGFYALSEKPLDGARASLARQSVLPGAVLQATLRFPRASGLQAARLEVFQPDGQAAEWLNQVVVGGRDGVPVPLPIALNDPRGEWTIKVTELFTGRTSSHSFRVE